MYLYYVLGIRNVRRTFLILVVQLSDCWNKNYKAEQTRQNNIINVTTVTLIHSFYHDYLHLYGLAAKFTSILIFPH